MDYGHGMSRRQRDRLIMQAQHGGVVRERVEGAPDRPLSYSSVKRFVECPQGYALRYIDGLAPCASEPAQFGKLVHAVLESVVREHGRDDEISTAKADEAHVGGWAAIMASSGRTGATDVAAFKESQEILCDFVKKEGVLECTSVLGLEIPFCFECRGFTVRGVIDRVNKIDHETIEVVDYKTNRQIISQQEADESLQMSIYQLAAEDLFPWAKKVRLVFNMLRHGVKVRTSRSFGDQLAARGYLRAIGEAIKGHGPVWEARLGQGCTYCDMRHHCRAYSDAVDYPHLPGSASVGVTLEEIVEERKKVVVAAKALEERKKELDSVIKRHIAERGEFTAAGMRCRMVKASTVTYSVEDANLFEVLGRVTGLAPEEVAKKVTTVGKGLVDALLKKSCQGRKEIDAVKTELEETSKKSFSSRLRIDGVK